MLRALKAVALPLVWLVAGALLAVLTLYGLTVRAMPPLGAWQEARLPDDFQAGSRVTTMAEYLALENRIFDALAQDVDARRLDDDDTGLFDRYAPGSVTNPATFARNWNRTWIADAPNPVGGALLLHGLSDSPYSLRALAEQLHAGGYSVVVLRLPGHGTVPTALAAANWRDWRAAVDLAERHLRRQLPAGRPLIVAGYSNGALLAADLALVRLDANEPPPDRLVLLSPAIGVTPVAVLAVVQRWMSTVPGLGKLAWTSIGPEYDPFKYASFPVRAAEDIFDLSREVERRLTTLSSDGRLARFPPTLAFQSVVDATIVASGIADRLLARTGRADSELVLFDVNRRAAAAPFLRLAANSLPDTLVRTASLPYALTVVTNATPSTMSVVARRRGGGTADWTSEPLDLTWPAGVYSLSHVAVPFPPDDPVYGATPDLPTTGRLNLGGLALRGERHIFAVSGDDLLRLRYNPFFPYLARRVTEWLATPR